MEQEWHLSLGSSQELASMLPALPKHIYVYFLKCESMWANQSGEGSSRKMAGVLVTWFRPHNNLLRNNNEAVIL